MVCPEIDDSTAADLFTYRLFSGVCESWRGLCKGSASGCLGSQCLQQPFRGTACVKRGKSEGAGERSQRPRGKAIHATSVHILLNHEWESGKFTPSCDLTSWVTLLTFRSRVLPLYFSFFHDWFSAWQQSLPVDCCWHWLQYGLKKGVVRLRCPSRQRGGGTLFRHRRFGYGFPFHAILLFQVGARRNHEESKFATSNPHGLGG